MRGIAAIVICVLGGCAREKALLVEVETDDKTSNVELLLVQQPCPDCTDGMGLPGQLTKKTPGTVFYTDGDDRVYAPVDPTAKRARFWIEPGTDGHLLRIVAVGFDIQDQPTSLMDVPDLNVSDHLGERFDVTLAPHAIGRPPAIANVGPIADQDTVMLWRPPASAATTNADHASCMMVTHASDRTTEFLVPPIDSDCDTVIEGECDRTWYQHAVTPDITQICLDTGRHNACRIGNPSSCVDGLGPTCATGSTCIPDGACTICSRLDSTCVDNLFTAGLSPVPRLECSVPVNTNAAPPYPLCSSGAAVDGTAFAGCTSAAFAPVGMLAYPLTTVSMFTYSSANASATVGISPTTTACNFSITINASVSDTFMMFSAHPAAFVLKGASGDTMVIPFVVTFHGVTSCTGNMMTCTFAPASSTQNVWSCGK